MESLPITEYLKKIDQAQAMLDEVREGLLSFQQEIDDSIERGKKDIEEGRVTICTSQEELHHFFESI